MYEYKVISGQLKVNYNKNETMESVLTDMLNSNEAEGWEFFSQGSITEKIDPGCLAALLGHGPQIINHQTFIFRRKKQTKQGETK